MAPLLDVLITLLQWGESGWRTVLQQREALFRCAIRHFCPMQATMGHASN